VQAFARSQLAIVAAGVWGYAEATHFWLIPDILLGWIALHRPASIIPSVIAANLGALAGGVRMHQHASEEQAPLTQIPGITEAMLLEAHERFASQRWGAVIRAPIDGIPYKVYAIESGLAGASVGELIVWTPIARSGRFLLSSLGAGLIGVIFAPSVRRHGGFWLALSATFWLVGYLRYFARLRRRYPR